MRWLISILSLLIFVIVVYSCVNNQNSVSAKENIENMETLPANLAGIYQGNLPCVDCEAINTLLELHKDKSYVLKYTYDGKSEDQFIKEGEWNISKNTLILEGVDYKYKISSENLTQLDLSGNEIRGDVAEKYQLSRIK